MESKHLQSLVWLRAFAAFSVVLSHVLRAAEVKYSVNDEVGNFFLLSYIDIGTFGVYLFFTLSGCTLYLSSEGKINNFKDFGGFYFKRFMRIWPAFAISLLLYIIFIEIFRAFYISDHSFWIASFLDSYTIYNVFQYLSLTFNFTGPNGLFIGPYWSLPVEFQYYLLLPFALFLMKSNRLTLVTPLIFGAALYYIYQRSFFIIDRHEVFKMGYTFFGGVLLAVIYKKINIRMPMKIAMPLILVVIIYVVLVRANILVIPEKVLFLSDKENLYGFLSLVCVGIALFAMASPISNGFIRIVNTYGEISYSIYLFHMMFIGISVLLITHFEIYGSNLKTIFILLFSVISSYVFSKYTYIYIEKKSMIFARKIVNKSS